MSEEARTGPGLPQVRIYRRLKAWFGAYAGLLAVETIITEASDCLSSEHRLLVGPHWRWLESCLGDHNCYRSQAIRDEATLAKETGSHIASLKHPWFFGERIDRLIDDSMVQLYSSAIDYACTLAR